MVTDGHVTIFQSDMVEKQLKKVDNLDRENLLQYISKKKK